MKVKTFIILIFFSFFTYSCIKSKKNTIFYIDNSCRLIIDSSKAKIFFNKSDNYLIKNDGNIIYCVSFNNEKDTINYYYLDTSFSKKNLFAKVLIHPNQNITSIFNKKVFKSKKTIDNYEDKIKVKLLLGLNNESEIYSRLNIISNLITAYSGIDYYNNLFIYSNYISVLINDNPDYFFSELKKYYSSPYFSFPYKHSYKNPFFSNDGTYVTFVFDLYKMDKYLNIIGIKNYIVIYDFKNKRLVDILQFKNAVKAKISDDKNELIVMCQSDSINANTTFDTYTYKIFTHKIKRLGKCYDAIWLTRKEE
jgi:hypothetical protein